MTVVLPLHEQEEIHRRRWFVLGVMCLSLVMVVIAVSSLNVALPTMQQDLGASASEIHWILDSYALVFAGVLLMAGAIGDRFGRKGALLAGLGIFGVGALIAGTAGTAAMVIAGRVVMGVGAAFVMPATLSLITAVFPPHERSRAIAIWAGFAGAGGAFGPIISGALLEEFWWGSTIIFNLPVIAFVAAAVAIFAPRSRDDDATPLDPTGAVLSLVGLTALLFGVIEGPERGWTSAVVLGSFALSAVVLGAFIGWERRTEHPMLPIDFFRDRRFSVGSGVITVAFFAMFGFFFLFSQYLQFGRGYSALLTGVATLPFALTMIVVAPRSAALAERIGGGPIIVAGFLFMGAGFGVLSLVGVSSPYVVLAVALVLLAVGMSITAAPSTGSIMSAVPLAKAGVGSAVNDTTRELGGALGIAVLGSIVSANYRSSVDLGGIALPAESAAQVTESAGAANGVAAQLGGDGGALVATRAADAFTDAFNVASIVSLAIALAAAAAVAVTFGRRKEQEAAMAFTVAGRPGGSIGVGAVAREAAAAGEPVVAAAD
ncbi:MAG: MFS transporter [Actinomycetota bacterium]|nr:MFS transporter [Actinomycetota bacterium]